MNRGDIEDDDDYEYVCGLLHDCLKFLDALQETVRQAKDMARSVDLKQPGECALDYLRHVEEASAIREVIADLCSLKERYESDVEGRDPRFLAHHPTRMGRA